MNEYIYFICFYRDSERSAITVVDLQQDMSYEKQDFAIVNENEYDTREEAIESARDIAKRHNLQYIPFVSRYRNDPEYLY
jgi:hypothetical protein